MSNSTVARAVPSVHRDSSGAPSQDEASVAGTAMLAGRTAGALTIAVCAIGAIVHLAFVPPARHWLAFPFSGVPARAGEVAVIFTHNLLALGAIGGLLLIAQVRHRAGESGAIQRGLQHAGEFVLGAAVAANLIVIGASIGAYGARMIHAALPHGPVELSAYSLALALYLEGRHRPLAINHIHLVGALSVGLLALAAVLETFVNV
jgi:hypothetical protein